MYFVYVRDRFHCYDESFDQLIGVFESQDEANKLKLEYKEAFFPNHRIVVYDDTYKELEFKRLREMKHDI